MTRDDQTAPSIADIARLAEAARAALPAVFRAHADAVQIRVEDLADPALLNDLQIENPFELTGLYDGVPLTEKSLSEPLLSPDIIFLFRRALLDEWIARGDVALDDLVQHVLIHELAHHFGWSDAEIARIDPWWE